MPAPTHRSRSLAHAGRNRLPFTAAAKHLSGTPARSDWTPSAAPTKALLEDEVLVAKGVPLVGSGRAGSDGEESGSDSSGSDEGATCRAGQAGAVEVNLAELAQTKRSLNRRKLSLLTTYSGRALSDDATRQRRVYAGRGGRPGRADPARGNTELTSLLRPPPTGASSDFELVPRQKNIIALSDTDFAALVSAPAPINFAEPLSVPGAQGEGDDWELLEFDSVEGGSEDGVTPVAKPAVKRSWARIVG